MSSIIHSPVSPFADASSLSIPLLMTRFNPDVVLNDKVIHTDSFSDQPITYGGLRDQASRAAWGLRHKINVQEGDIVLALIPNSNGFVYLAHATWWAGAVFAPLNPSSTTSDISHVLQIVQPTHIVTVEAKLGNVQEALQSLKIKSPKLLTCLSRVDGFLQFPNDFIGSDAEQRLEPYDLGEKHPRDVMAAICFSSGTTGKVKGARLSHHNLVVNLLQIRTMIPHDMSSAVREAWFPPYCHIYGLMVVVLGGMWVGGRYDTLASFDLATFYRKSVEINATHMHLVPPVALALAAMPDRPPDQPSELPSLISILVAAAPVKRNLQLRMKQKFPRAVIAQAYGLTECSPSVMHQTRDDDHCIGSVGKVFPGTEVRLVDPDTGKDVAPGEQGELWVRGPQVMMGYIRDEAATKATFAGDWLRTGDIMRVDERQNFWVTDRLKEMIKYKGFQVAPSELEDTLLGHPDVTDAAVCAIYDNEQASEVPLAYVSLKAEKLSLSGAEKQRVLDGIKDWVNQRVAGYKKIRRDVLHLQTLPKSVNGKILRRQLPARLAEKRSSGL